MARLLRVWLVSAFSLACIPPLCYNDDVKEGTPFLIAANWLLIHPQTAASLTRAIKRIGEQPVGV